jgi:hypothetical protein
MAVVYFDSDKEQSIDQQWFCIYELKKQGVGENAILETAFCHSVGFSFG